MRPIFLIFLISTSWSICSQNLSHFPVDFYRNDTLIKNATAGGLDLPQFSATDLNEDGLPDLYIFDKLGNVQLGFLNDGLVGEASYTFDYNLTQHFPPLREWALLKDFNQDGAPDIFAYSDIVGVDGIQVHQGHWENGQLHFSRMEFPAVAVDLLPFSNGSTWERIAPSKFDFPAFEDMDDDGDLDILAFGSMSSYVEFYQNQSIEMGYGLDSLIFERADVCWGKFLQDPNSSAIIMSDNPEDCAYNSPNLDEVHTIASSLIAVNLDGDEDKDLIFTNFEGNEIISLLNTGQSSAIAHITELDSPLPVTNFPEIPPFIKTPYLLDLDNDDRRDIVVSNFVFGRESYRVGWIFKNMGSAESPVFELVKDDFLTDEMLDFGSGAHPEFVDYNADGLMDLVVGNAQLWTEDGTRTGSLRLFLNIGTPINPIFELTNEDWLGFAADTLFHSNLAPAFGDLDGDGDLDLLVGESQNRLSHFENTAGAGNEMLLELVTSNYMGLGDVELGTELSPQIIDVNEDGLLDLIIGERIGNLNYFQNVGTSTAPVFDSNPDNAPNSSLWGGIDLNFPGSSSGNTSPFLVKVDETFKLLLGTENMGLLEYENITDNLSGEFTAVSGDFSATIREGHFLNPALADLDSDGFLELVVGNARGGVSFFKTNWHSEEYVTTYELTSVSAIQIHPNPFSDSLFIGLDDVLNVDGKVFIYNAAGQLQQEITLKKGSQIIDTSAFDSGIHFLKIEWAGRYFWKKIVKP